MNHPWIAPDVDFLDAAGRTVRLRDFRGRTVLLVFLRWLG